mmetsp:Transcript_21872/g.65568  ORF Transcript_21872/g.65568 Transcript_21872/m.65568 type:complete len:526 (+) Transcript_21872:224-1801(+)
MALRLVLALSLAAHAFVFRGGRTSTRTRLPTKRHLLDTVGSFFGRGEDEKLEFEETPLWLAARRGLANCVVIAFEDYDGGSQSQAETELAAAQVRLQALTKALLDARPGASSPRASLGIARLATWTGGGFGSGPWVNQPEDWAAARGDDWGEAASEADDADAAAVAALAKHVLEKYDAPEPLRAAVLLDATSDPQRTNRISLRFLRAYAATAAGDSSVRAALQAFAPALTKKASAAFCAAAGPPLAALRTAQAAAKGAPAWAAEAVATSVFGARLNEPEVESFLEADALQWVATHAEALEEPATVRTYLDYFCERRRADAGYSCAGRTPKTVEQQADAYALSTTLFEDDEAFLPNAYGLKPMILEDAVIPRCNVSVPYDEPYNFGHGPYELGEGTERGGTPVTVRVEEVLSLKRLIYEGQMLDNCLEDRRSSQVKYVLRARQRTSSFWSFTLTNSEGVAKHVLLLEVWHLRRGHVVRQAEGQRPRTLPSPEAWHWMRHWCDREGVDWTTWDIYSRLEQIYPVEPL